MQAGSEQRPVDARAELQHARVQRLVAAGARRGLDDAGVGLASIRRTSVVRHSPVMTLSASSTTM